MVIVAAVVLMLGLVYFVERTRTGRAMRAVSEDKDVAAMMGINVDRIIVTTFAVGGLLAGAAGILYALIFGQVDWFMGFLPGIKAFTAAVLGGIGNITGAMLGGLTLGMLENVGPPLLLSGAGVPSPNQLRDVIAFTVLVLVLIFRPNGILGSNEPGR
jgi:branched-chain amino acid transport system permease protein